jgi:hypothetical protein
VLNSVIGNMSNVEDVEDVPDEDEESVIPSTKRTRRSLAWNYFEKYFDERGPPRARCLKCGTSYVAKEDSGTKKSVEAYVEMCRRNGHIILPTTRSKQV